MRVLSLFDGIGVGREALKHVPGIEYYASEICPHAIKVCRSNHPDVTHVGDVRALSPSDFPDIDLMLAGPPCQGLSRAGEQRGLDDDRSCLFWEFVRLLRGVRPRWWLMENVRMDKHVQAVISRTLGVHPLAVNSRLVSCQNRPRLYWTNIPQKGITDRGLTLTSVIGPYDHLLVVPRGWNRGGPKRYRGDKAPCVTTSSWQHNFHVVQGGVKRKFTPEEAETFQTLPRGYTSAASASRRYQLVGNAWTLAVVSELLYAIMPRISPSL